MSSENPTRFQRLLGSVLRMSLKARLVLLTAGFLVVCIWALAFLSVTVLRGPFEDLLFEQQLAATRRVAREVDTRLKDNIDGLTRIAAGLPAALSYDLLQPLLAQRPYLHIAFSGGIAVIGLDGVAIADYPVVPGRRGTYYGDRDCFRRVIASGKPYVDKPIIGRALKRPVLAVAVPVFAADGRLRAVLAGVTDLTAENFLGFVADRAQTGAGEYFVFSLRDRIVIAATDSERIMQPSPVRGSNLLYDRMVDGFEGSGVAVSSKGISKLYSGVRVPTADWLILSALPAELAFRPLHTLRNYLYVIAALLTLAAVLLIQLLLRRLLAPLATLSAAIRRMTGGQVPVELGVVIAKTARHVMPTNALDHIAGYVVVNDVSDRGFQNASGQWDKGKGCDTFGPVGPWLVTPDEVADPQDLALWLDLNGRRMQAGNTRNMIFPLAELIANVSGYITLEPGDILTTGTPRGVGADQKPEPVFLKPGDVMRLGVDKLGFQEQKVVAWHGSASKATRT